MKPTYLNTVPGVQPLPRGRRRFVFLALVLFFFVAVPVFVFYATGYRYNFMDADATITATGGIYVNIGAGKGEVYLNELPVSNLRIFRNAVFIQDLTPGMQRLHVQEPLMHTWVKELPVYPYIVTEAEAFAFPLVPQVRPITEYQTSTGTPIIFGTTTPDSLFSGVSTSIAVIGTTSKATTTLTRNTEYKYLLSLFSTSTATSTTLLSRVANGVTEAFTFSNKPVATTTEETATTTKTQNDLKLYQSGDDIFVDFIGSEHSIPYYFCVPKASLASTTALYGAEVTRGVAMALAARPEVSETANLERICRSTIKIDRQWQKVEEFDFFPSATDLIIMHRSDGIFVTEVDDRSWQNTQALYPHPVDEMILNNGKIYVKHGTLILELLTTIPVAS
jgi:hypothetical protein